MHRRAGSAIPAFLVCFAFFTPFSIAGAHISLTLAGLAFLTDPQSRSSARRLARGHFLMRPVVAWCVVSIVAALFAIDLFGSVIKLKKLLLLTLLPLGALPQVRARIGWILGALLSSAAAVSTVGLARHLLAGGGLAERLRGITGHYLTIAGILMVVTLVAVGIAASGPGATRPCRRFAGIASAGVLSFIALMATYARGSWLGFGAGALFLLRRNRWPLLALVAAGTLFAMLGPQDARDRLRSIVDPDHPRNIERVLIWEHGLELSLKRPWSGLGLVIPAGLMEKEVATEHGVIRVHSHMHNTPLQIVVSMGFPALAVFGWLVAAWFRLGKRALPGAEGLWERGLVAAYPAVLSALLVNGLVEWNFGDSEILGLFHLLTGLVLGVESAE